MARIPIHDHSDNNSGGKLSGWNAIKNWAAVTPSGGEGGGSGSSGGFETYDQGGNPLVHDHGSMGSTETIDAANGNRHRGTLDANCTITVAPFADGSIDFAVTQDGTGGWDITWSGVTFADDDQPDQTIGAVTWFVLVSDDGVVYGFKAGGGGATALDDLTDVTITSPATADRLRYNGSVWANSALVSRPLMVEDPSSGNWFVVVTGDGDAVMVEA